MKEDGRSRWFALLLVCAAQLMIVLGGTIVNEALPVIEQDQGFSRAALSWVVNAYLLTFGGFLLLGGRAGAIFVLLAAPLLRLPERAGKGRSS